MLRLFQAEKDTIRELPKALALDDQAVARALWIDAQDPDEHERELLQRLLNAELPESEDVEEIESSARFFIDNQGLHVHSLFLAQEEGRHVTVTVAFILQRERLISVREEDLADFRLLRMRARHGQVHAGTPQELLVTIFEQKVENLADTIEDLHRRLEEVSFMVLEDENAELEDAIDKLAKIENSNGRIRLCLMDTQRAVSFLLRHLRDQNGLQETCREMIRDLETLMAHTNFVFEKINFLMDSAQGFINIEQNQIIKIFSIAAVVFLPPTLVASIYGMNFEHMPELHLEYGYPLALILMVISGFAPYFYFKRKGWL
ncbi:magnesium/cobalt transporter CorA [Tepidiphilus olei]|uniref:magnesium/cobalt transporter CorA n=1 Tax=Tepidiphilus olei TaxID=2502184 RepID=UPI00115DE2D2|nr:magnesium/cobalt transporter CorA [Tepidiphilus olei]